MGMSQAESRAQTSRIPGRLKNPKAALCRYRRERACRLIWRSNISPAPPLPPNAAGSWQQEQANRQPYTLALGQIGALESWIALKDHDCSVIGLPTFKPAF